MFYGRYNQIQQLEYQKIKDDFRGINYFCITINSLKSKIKAWNTLISLR